ncbi:MAG: hypothetical protein J5925_01715 [Clostridia bacterium]|nr:hypothetical protein [Clostridia bacterium]MBR5746321.1 hypothetical protein [Clostridia bacterium]
MSENRFDRIQPTAVLVIEANGRRLYAVPEGNAAAREFVKMLCPGAVKVRLHACGAGFEAPLHKSIPHCEGRAEAAAGGVIVYPDGRIAVCTGEAEGGFARVAQIHGAGREELFSFLGEDGAETAFYLEWSE